MGTAHYTGSTSSVGGGGGGGTSTASVAGASADIIALTRTPRGFQVYGSDVKTDHGHTVSFNESSGAGKGPVCWMRIEKPEPQHPGDVPGCDVGVHMTLNQAIAIRNRLQVFIDEAARGNTCEIGETR